MLATRVSKGIIMKPTRPLSLSRSSEVCNSFVPIDRKGLSNAEIVESCHLSLRNRAFLSPLVTQRRKPDICVCDSQLSSDYDVSSSDVEEETLSSAGEDTLKLTGTPASQSKSWDVKHELLMLSLPAIGGQALEPLAQLMETAYIGRLGPVELGSAGVSTNIFNCISKLFNIPLLSIATSFVAEDISKNSVKDSASEDSTNGKPAERKQLSSVSTALLLAVGIGIIEALALYLGSGKFLDLMGISSGSSMRIPAQRFLSLRAFGAPAVVVSLALQGVFRGFKDTKTPVLCLGIGNLSAVFLFPILMYYFKLGATGAAISTVLSQYIVTFLLIWHLNKRAVLLPPKLGSLQFGGYLKSGGFLLGRTLAVLITMTLGTSMAARQGPVAMAAHQICLQVWLAVSLLTDALAASGQALIASSFSKGDYQSVKDVADYVLKIGLFTGVFLSAILGVSFGSLATVFTKDAEVLGIVRTGVLGGIVQCSPGMASCSSCVITGNTNRWSMASLKSALPPPSLRFPTMAAATSFQSKPKPKSKLLLRSFNGLAPLQPSLFPTSCPEFTSFGHCFPTIGNGGRVFAMRHGRRVPKLNRPPDQRKALIRGLTTQLLKHGRIKTTRARASAVRKYVDKMITLAKDGSLHKRRQALGFIYEKQIVHALFAEAPERYGERNGGYTRILFTLPRRGDNAPMAYIELV